MKRKIRSSIVLMLAALLLLVSIALLPSAGPVRAGEKGESREFTDSAGRTVMLPQKLEKVAPSGPLAQIVLYTAVPDKLIAVSHAFGKKAKGLIDEKYLKLPEFGQFYGKNTSLNLEALLAASPDVVIDIGEAKDSIVEDMDKLQEQIGIPCVFIEAYLKELPATYEKLAELFGEDEHLTTLSKMAGEILDRSARAQKKVRKKDRLSVYWAMGKKGTNTNAVRSFHAEALGLVPVINVADVEASSRGAGTEVSMEQIMQWDPDFLLIDSPELLAEMEKDESWQAVPAFKEKKYAVVPNAPYCFLANPPSVNRLMGMDWLGKLLYPEQYDFEMDEQLKAFYKIFYSIELTDEQAEDILDPTVDPEDDKDAAEETTAR